MKTRTLSRREGSTLIMAVALLCIVVTAVEVASELTMQTARLSRGTTTSDAGAATADAYLDWAYDYWKTTCRQSNNVPLPTASFSALPQPPSLVYPTGFSVVTAKDGNSSYRITALDPQLQALASSTTTPIAAQSQSSGDQSYFYLASIDLTVPTLSRLHPTQRLEARRIFQKTLSSPWQDAIFYNDELEIHPSPKFTVTGKVHTNGILYACPDGGNPLIFANPVVEYGVPPPAPNLVDGYDPIDAPRRGKPQAGAANTYTQAPVQAQVQVPFGIDSSQFSSTNPNDSSYRELIERPNPNYPDEFKAGTDQNGTQINPRYYDAAAIKVLIDANNNLTVIKGTGANGTTLPTNDSTYLAVVAAISTNQNVQDYREAATVRLTTLDVAQLNTQLKASKIPGWNGVIYISDTSAGQTGGTPKRGIRVKNGGTAPDGGLTVASDNPLYVQGDFNTQVNAQGNHQSCAFAGDAINVYSNAWNDANSTGTRTATNTTINAAFLSGIVPTGTYNGQAQYSGGVENFPRFHENWSGQTFTYNGSMVELFYSQQATGLWSQASYSPPTRNWAFDTIFLTQPPPGSLMVVSYTKQAYRLRPNYQ